MRLDLLTWAETIIALERQALTLIELRSQGVQNYCGKRPVDVLVQTARAIVEDTRMAEEMHGASEWMARKRRNAEGWLNDFGPPPMRVKNISSIL